MVLRTLAHHIDVEWMGEAYQRTRKDGAVGVDGVTAEQYEERLEENLSELLDRFKSGRYRAPPVRWVNIPKEGGRDKTRPIGIPTLEDKVVTACGADGVGAGVRAGLCGLLVWVPPGTKRTPSTGGIVERVDGHGRGLGD